MIAQANKMNPAPRPRKTLVRTTVLDLLKELTALTKDDALVMAAVTNIFATCNVRLARTLAPVRLVAPRVRRRHRPVWA
jgi:hypothetical protein